MHLTENEICVYMENYMSNGKENVVEKLKLL